LKAIALGGTHSLALLNDGTVWAWGSNLSGQLGIGNHDNSLGSELFPVQVCAPGETSIWDGINLLLTPCSAFLNGVTAIAAGANFSMALLSNGAVVTWGDNQKDQLGTSTTEGCDTSGGTNYVQACSSTPVPVAW
jgi:alpha-tubulin suppressor-like RCC1 family protein